MKRILVICALGFVVVTLAQCVSPVDVDTPRKFGPVTGEVLPPAHLFVRANFRMQGLMDFRQLVWPLFADKPDTISASRIDTVAEIDSVWFDVRYERMRRDSLPMDPGGIWLTGIHLHVGACPANGEQIALEGGPEQRRYGIAIDVWSRPNNLHDSGRVVTLRPGDPHATIGQDQLWLGPSSIKFFPRNNGAGVLTGVLKTVIFRQSPGNTPEPIFYSGNIEMAPY